jgi:GMP synthase (glutamine-hydrolysing)
MNAFVNDEINKIKQTVGQEKVLCALSGGVDSAVTAAIIAKAIGKNLTCLFVDHGLLRKNEAANVVKVFSKF